MSHRVILITGASAGIGRSCAITLSKAFPNEEHSQPLVLFLVGRREEELKKTGDACKEGTIIEVQTGDMGKEEDVERIFSVVKEKYGRLDLLFNNAGINLLRDSPIEENDMVKFRQVLETNIMAAVLAFILMKSQSPKGGRIVNNGSISVDSPRPSKSLRTSSKLITDSFSYTISKHAILGLTHSTSLDGRKHGIVCTQLDIGNAATDLSAHSSKGTFQADGSNKVEPMMDVENVGKTLVFLAKLPLDTDVLRMNIVAAGMPFIGRG